LVVVVWRNRVHTFGRKEYGSIGEGRVGAPEADGGGEDAEFI